MSFSNEQCPEGKLHYRTWLECDGMMIQVEACYRFEGFAVHDMEVFDEHGDTPDMDAGAEVQLMSEIVSHEVGKRRGKRLATA